MEAWDNFISFLEEKYGKATVEKWVKSLKIVRFDACNIFLKSNDFFQTQWINEYILPLAKKHFLDSNGKSIKIHIESGEEKKKNKALLKNVPINFTSDVTYPVATFEGFYPSEENQFTFMALSNIFYEKGDLSKPKNSIDDVPTPIYIHGPRGSGKTHLLMACKTQLERAGKNVFFVNADTFTDHVVHAIRFGKMETFRKTYRNIDALIVDDIDTLSRKNATQEEFFHTFNTLQSSGAIIILSSVFSPRKLEYIEERLVSRFEWGILFNLSPTKDKDIVANLLNNRLRFLGLVIDELTEDYLLQNFKTCDDMSLAIESLSKSSISDTISFNTSKPIFDRLIEKRLQDGLNPDRILEEIAKVFGIRVIDMQSKAQTRDCVLPRQFAMFFLRHELKLPFMKIGYIFKKDHSTVITSIRHIENLAAKSHEETVYYINAISASITKVRSSIELATV